MCQNSLSRVAKGLEAAAVGVSPSFAAQIPLKRTPWLHLATPDHTSQGGGEVLAPPWVVVTTAARGRHAVRKRAAVAQTQTHKSTNTHTTITLRVTLFADSRGRVIQWFNLKNMHHAINAAKAWMPETR